MHHDDGYTATTIVVEATFVPHPDDKPTDDYVRMLLTDGTMTWSFTDHGEGECTNTAEVGHAARSRRAQLPRV